MSLFAKFIEQIKILFALAMLQKSLRLFVRAFWLGLAGVLVGWALNDLWGWLPNPLTWVALGLGFALMPMVGIFIALYPIMADHAPPAAWIDSLDRRLRQRQQLSTAWEVARKGGKAGLVADLLVQDVLALFPRARESILRGGWYRKIDLAAAGLLTILCLLLLMTLQFQATPDQRSSAPEQQGIPNTAPQPPAGQDSAAEPQQNGGPGEQNGAPQEGQNGTDGQGTGEQNQDQGQSAPNPDQGTASEGAGDSQDQAAVAEALRQLGSELQPQAGTHELGESLQNLDMNSAADALEELGEQMDEMSPETRENLSEALEEAANQMGEANAPELGQDMQDAADALEDPETGAEQAMGQLADNLRQLDGQMQDFQGGMTSGGQGDSGESGQAEPADRLLNENGHMEIPQENTTPSGLLSPARPDAEVEGTASGSLNASQPQQSQAGQTPLIPSSFLWKWRDVVSQYFQR